MGRVLAEAPAGRMDVLAEALAAALASVRDAAGGCACDLRSAARNTEEEPERIAARRSASAARDELHVAAGRIIGAFSADIAAGPEVVWLDRPAAAESAREPSRQPPLRGAALQVGGVLGGRPFRPRPVAAPPRGCRDRGGCGT